MSVTEKGIFGSSMRSSSRIIRQDEQTILVRSPAKINFTLAVGAERPDGYHMFESLMAAVSLCDDLVIRRGKPGISITCDQPDVPVDNQNLVYRAASLLAWSARISPAVEIELIKRIPTQAGLGGASTNAAAALLGLNELWELNLPLAKLHQISSVLGSDVNFFLAGPLAVCKGRGEVVEPVGVTWDFRAVIIQPRCRSATSEIYKYHRVSDRSCFGLADELAEVLCRCEYNVRPSEMAERCRNDLETAAFRINGELGVLRAELEQCAGTPVRLSGSGSAMFAMFDQQDDALQFVQRINEKYPELASWLVQNNPW